MQTHRQWSTFDISGKVEFSLLKGKRERNVICYFRRREETLPLGLSLLLNVKLLSLLILKEKKVLSFLEAYLFLFSLSFSVDCFSSHEKSVSEVKISSLTRPTEVSPDNGVVQCQSPSGKCSVLFRSLAKKESTDKKQGLSWSVVV